MRTPSALRRLLCVAPLLPAAPFALLAQSPGDARIAPASRPIAAWASVAIGPGSVAQTNTSPVAGSLRANVTVGHILVMYRKTAVGPFFGSGDGVSDDSYLIGTRTFERRAFATAAIGYDHARRYHESCEGCARTTDSSSTSALAWDLSLHANAVVPGVSLSYAGALGPSRVRYSALTFGIELGWFGK